MLNRLDEVLLRWSGVDGPTLRPPAGEAALANDWGFEASALACWSLWSHVDGFAPPGDQDREGFCFWPVARMELASNHDGGRHVNVGSPPMVLFADYLTWCWAYGIVVDSASPDFGSVFLVGTKDGFPQLVASSFDEFLGLYLDDSPRIYPV